MKILFVVPYFYPEGSGVGKLSLELAKQLFQKNEIHIVCSGKKDEIKKINGLKVQSFKSDFKFSNTPIRLNLFFKLNELMKKEKFDLVQAFTPVPYYCDIAALAAKHNSTPFFLIYNSFNYKRDSPLMDSLSLLYQEIIEPFTLNSGKIVIYNKNLKNAKDFLPHYKGNFSFISPIFEPKKAQNNGKSGKNLLFVANLWKFYRWKGLEYLIQSMEILKEQGEEIPLTIVGDGEMMDFYKKLVEEKNLKKQITFSGFLNEKDLMKSYLNSIALVVPSYGGLDLLPTTILEASSLKKPTIATTAGGIPYFVKNNENGLLVEPKDPNSLAEAILKITKDKNLAKKLGKNAYEKVRDLSYKRSASELQSIYTKAL